jgi:glycosyltransferase involved in cell wall biosynthesis
MKRILILNANLRERGTWFRARRIARGLYHRGHEVTFVCQGEGWYRPRLSARLPRWTEWETASWNPIRPEEWHAPLALLQRLVGLRGRWDFIYTFSHHPIDAWVARSLKRAGTFWMTDWCDLWDSEGGGVHDMRLWGEPLPAFARGWRGVYTRASYRFEDRLERGVLREADAVSVIVRPLRDRALNLGVDPGAVLHLVSGADVTRFGVVDRGTARQALGLPEDALVAGYVANYTLDNEQLEGALGLAWERFPGLRLLSAGPRWYRDDGPVARAAALGLVHDLGRRPFAEIPTVLAAADFLLMPMRDTAMNQCRWPNKFGDYLAAGRPTATTRVGDAGEVVVRHGVGVAGEPTHEGLADAIAALAANDQLRAEAGRRARSFAESHLRWGGRVRRLVAYLEKRGLRL